MMRTVIAVTIVIASTLAAPASASVTDAELLALEVSGELLPPPELVAHIDADLAAVRQQDPYFESFHTFTDWFPGLLLVTLTPEAWQAFENGQYDGWNELNDAYEVTVTSDNYPRARLVWLSFVRPYHPVALAAMYSEAPGVEQAEPVVQFDGPYDIEAETTGLGELTGTYTFQQSWADCTPAGCNFYQRNWVFAVSASGVTLLEENGPPLAVEPGTWGGIKNLFRDP